MVISGLWDSPDRYPFAIDTSGEALGFAAFGASDYRRTSFLDERALAPGQELVWLSFADVERAPQDRPCSRPLHYIFHAGHVGSTLLSRLLDEMAGVLPLREPLPLRTLADLHDSAQLHMNARLVTMLRLWERGYADTEAVVLKATSTTQRIAPLLLGARPDSRAIVLNLPLESYLCTIFSAPNSAADLNAHGPERWHRLRTFGVELPRPRTLPELAAMSWLAEAMTQERIKREYGARALALNFDVMLASLEEALLGVCEHFQLGSTRERARRVAGSPTLLRYSKAPEHAYSPKMRSELHAQARTAYADEIREGLNWLNLAAGSHDSVAALL